jgi:hypothetical protein
MKLALATLVSAAKLNADTTEENLEKALKAQADDLELTKAKLADRDGELVTLKAKADDDAKKGGAAGDVIKKLAERVDAQAAELKKLTDERATDAVTALQAKLESEGRILAAEKPMVAELIKNLGLTKATEFCATLPVKVDLKERGTNKPGPASGMDPVEAHKQLQLKAAELAKEKPVEAAHAYELACRANPDLAKAAAKLTSMKPDELDQVSPLTA